MTSKKKKVVEPLPFVGKVPSLPEINEQTAQIEQKPIYNISKTGYAGSGSGSSVVIYTVPVGKVFYLETIALSWCNNTASGLGGDSYIKVDNFGNLLLSATKFQDTGSNSLIFSRPLKFGAGTRFIAFSGDNGTPGVTTGASITGYEVEQK